MEADKISDFLADQRDQASGDAQALFLNFEDFWERKLWHQLTDALVEFFRLPESAPQRLPIFKSFILSFADRINQLKFVSLGLMASTQCSGTYSWKCYGGVLVLSWNRRPRTTCFSHITGRPGRQA
jgi:26S proteasome regulatory subunit N9